MKIPCDRTWLSMRNVWNKIPCVLFVCRSIRADLPENNKYLSETFLSNVFTRITCSSKHERWCRSKTLTISLVSQRALHGCGCLNTHCFRYSKNARIFYGLIIWATDLIGHIFFFMSHWFISWSFGIFAKIHCDWVSGLASIYIGVIFEHCEWPTRELVFRRKMSF